LVTNRWKKHDEELREREAEHLNEIVQLVFNNFIFLLSLTVVFLERRIGTRATP
jgi:hypothetical protein